MTVKNTKSINPRDHRDNTKLAVEQPGGGLRKGGTTADDHLLTVKQASEKCQVSERQLRRMIKTGALPVIRFGKAIRIRPRDLGL
jgi:excisionase family DNA binding protein